MAERPDPLAVSVGPVQRRDPCPKPRPQSAALRGWSRTTDLTGWIPGGGAPPRVAECRLQIEARVDRWYPLGDAAWIVVVEAVRVHAHPEIVAGPHHIDPRAWRPLIYNFRHYFELGRELGRTFRADTPCRRAGAQGGAGREPGGAAPGPGPTALRARPPGCPAS